MTGLELARRMVPEGVRVGIGVADIYDPKKRVVWLSRATARGCGMEALACAAHEGAHAVQHCGLRRSFRVWRSWPVQSPRVTAGGFAIAIAAVLLRWHPWAVAAVVVAVTVLRVCAVLWIEREASGIALAWLKLNGMEQPGMEAYLRRQWRTYLTLAIGL